MLECRALVWQDGWELDEAIHGGPASGQAVDVYLAHYDPIGNPNAELGLTSEDLKREVVLEFDRPILGVITDAGLLYASDRAMGHALTQYPIDTHNGIATTRGLDDANDMYTLSEDGQALTIRMMASGSTDQIRIVVQSDP